MIHGGPGIAVVGEAANGRQAMEMARQLRPDVVVMDVSMPVVKGIQATPLIKNKFPAVRVVGLSMHEDDEVSRKCSLRVLIDGFITKTASPDAVVKRFRPEVRAGRTTASGGQTGDVGPNLAIILL